MPKEGLSIKELLPLLSLHGLDKTQECPLISPNILYNKHCLARRQQRPPYFAAVSLTGFLCVWTSEDKT